MSSYSTSVYISDAERDALLAEIRDIDNYIATRREQIEKIKRQTKEKEEEIDRIKEGADRKIKEAVNSLVEGHRKKLTSLSHMAESEIAAQAGNLMDRLTGLRREISVNKLRADQLNAEISDIAQTIGDTFNRMMDREADTEKRARLLSEELNSMLSQIEQLNPEAFKPVEYQRIRFLVRQVDTNIANGDYNSALTVSQNGIIDSTQLLTRLMILNEEYSNTYAFVQSQMTTLGQRFEAFDSEADGVIKVNVGDETLDYDYDISFWSEGIFDELRERFNYITSVVAQSDLGKIPADQLQSISEELDNLSQLLDECDRRAREEMISSANVFHTAEVADEYLNQIGYRLQSSGYRDDDDRKPYTMTYVNGNGSKLAAVVSSSGNSERPSFIVEVISDNEVEADITKRGVMSGLQAAGAELTAPIISHDCDSNTTAEGFISRVVGESETLRQSRKPKIIKFEQ